MKMKLTYPSLVSSAAAKLSLRSLAWRGESWETLCMCTAKKTKTKKERAGVRYASEKKNFIGDWPGLIFTTTTKNKCEQKPFERLVTADILPIQGRERQTNFTKQSLRQSLASREFFSAKYR